MPFLIILALIVIVWMFVTFRARQLVRDCRWRQDHERDTPNGRYFVCMYCGAETFREDNIPPAVCLRPEHSDD